VVLFSGLWSQSLKNGNIWASRQRLQGLFGAKWFEKGVQRQIWNQKSPLLAGLSATTEENSLKPGMVGWRGSADRTRLQADSLPTGNFTGNFAFLGSCEPNSKRETAVLQAFLKQFPKQINRENI
jgi:hypothetical protein